MYKALDTLFRRAELDGTIQRDRMRQELVDLAVEYAPIKQQREADAAAEKERRRQKKLGIAVTANGEAIPVDTSAAPSPAPPLSKTPSNDHPVSLPVASEHQEPAANKETAMAIDEPLVASTSQLSIDAPSIEPVPAGSTLRKVADGTKSKLVVETQDDSPQHMPPAKRQKQVHSNGSPTPAATSLGMFADAANAMGTAGVRVVRGLLPGRRHEEYEDEAGDDEDPDERKRRHEVEPEEDVEEVDPALRAAMSSSATISKLKVDQHEFDLPDSAVVNVPTSPSRKPKRSKATATPRHNIVSVDVDAEPDEDQLATSEVMDPVTPYKTAAVVIGETSPELGESPPSAMLTSGRPTSHPFPHLAKKVQGPFTQSKS